MNESQGGESEAKARDLQMKFLKGVANKKRSFKRQWMEIDSLANRNSLLLLPYHAMLNHVEKLIEERRVLIQENPSKGKEFLEENDS